MLLKRVVPGLMILGLMTFFQTAQAGSKNEEVEPDYTKGEVLLGKGGKKDHNNYWVLGPIGAVGNIWATGKLTADTRTIQIRHINKGTPAEGVLRGSDVILGVVSPRIVPDEHLQVDAQCRRPGCKGKRGSCGHFAWDVRKALATAITEAEKTKNGGKLVLNIWRPETDVVECPLADSLGKPLKGRVLAAAKKRGEKNYKHVVKEPLTGKNMSVTITLPVKGTYSATSPWECKKTETIIDAACQSILKRGLFNTNNNIGRKNPNSGPAAYLDALGLLATGEEKYLPVIREYARVLASGCEGLDIMGDGNGVSSWNGGYKNIFLCEYYLATKDEKVLPGITALSTYLAMGQSGVGTWSHGMSYVKMNGLYGPAGAYGAMNQCSITCGMSLLLAQKFIKEKEIDDAVKRSLKFLRWYIDKGTIPYGDHNPNPNHDNNGRNSQATVFFDLAGDKEAANFFTRMTLASDKTREGGHTGHFFARQWGALGAARGGAAAAQAFAKNMRWYTELERRFDGSSFFQVQLHTNERAYIGWSTTGQRLMQHCLPRKKLYITGKGGSSIDAITGKELEAALAAGRFAPEEHSVKELLEALGSWSPTVRRMAGKELGKRDEDVVNQLIAMLKSPNRYARYGGCQGLLYAGRQSEAAVDALVKTLLNEKDLTLRYNAVRALRYRGITVNKKRVPKANWNFNGLGPTVKKATSALLKLAATYEPELDPYRKLHNEIALVLFYSGHVQDFRGIFRDGKGSETLDRPLLIAAIKSILMNPNGAARSEVSVVFDNLSKQDLEQLWGDIYYATKNKAPSGVMFAGGARINGVKIMGENHIKEGLEAGVEFVIREQTWGNFNRKRLGFSTLVPYGKALKPYYPELEAVIDTWAKHRKKDRQQISKKFAEMLEKAKKIDAPELISIKRQIEATPDPMANPGQL